MSFTRTLRESVLQIFVCNEREEKNGAEKTTGEDGNGVSFFFFFERERREKDKQERESVCKEDKGGREGS